MIDKLHVCLVVTCTKTSWFSHGRRFLWKGLCTIPVDILCASAHYITQTVIGMPWRIIIISDGSFAWTLGCDPHQEFMVLSWGWFLWKGLRVIPVCILCTSTHCITQTVLMPRRLIIISDGSIADRFIYAEKVGGSESSWGMVSLVCVQTEWLNNFVMEGDFW